jgi:hypothetical protein
VGNRWADTAGSLNSANPARRYWCSAKGNEAGSKSGKFSGRTTVHVTLKFPMTKPDSCTVAVIASLNRSGRIHLWVTGKRVPPGS